MAKPFALQPLMEILQERSDEATRQLGRLIAAEESAKSRLQLIEQYRAEYEQKMREAIGTGVTPQALRNYQDFISRIDEAIAQQQRIIQQAERNTRAGQEHWREQNKRLKAVDTLSQRHEARERQRENKADQKLQDEFSTRKYANRPEDGRG